MSRPKAPVRQTGPGTGDSRRPLRCDARDAHQRAIQVHERAAALFSAHGRGAPALRECEAAQRERDRLRDADTRIARLQQPRGDTVVVLNSVRQQAAGTRH